jgi:hypothetical protein
MPPATKGEDMNSDSKLIILGFAGVKRSGKNSAAEFFKEAIQGLGREYVVETAAFADELREHMRILNPIVCHSVNGQSLVHWNDAIQTMGYENAKTRIPEMRRLMQIYGTEVIRARVGEDYWTSCMQKKALKAVETHQAQNLVLLITDMRFINEFHAMTAPFNGMTNTYFRLIALSRPSLLGGTVRDTVDTHTSEDLSWISEYVLNYFTKSILNNGNLSDLKHKCENVVKELVENKIL